MVYTDLIRVIGADAYIKDSPPRTGAGGMNQFGAYGADVTKPHWFPLSPQVCVGLGIGTFGIEAGGWGFGLSYSDGIWGNPPQLSISMTIDGGVVMTGSGTEVNGPFRFADRVLFHFGTWSHIQVWAMHTDGPNNTGTMSAALYVEEELILTGSWNKIPTQGRSGFNNFGVGRGGGNNASADDIYVTTGELLGDCSVETLYAVADGAPLEWSAKSGGAHYAEVDEAYQDGDTSYIYTSSDGAVDRFSFQSTGTTSADVAIPGISVTSIVDTDDGGHLNHIVTLDGTDFEHSLQYQPTTSYTFGARSAFRCHPTTAAEITPEMLDSILVGVKRIP